MAMGNILYMKLHEFSIAMFDYRKAPKVYLLTFKMWRCLCLRYIFRSQMSSHHVKPCRTFAPIDQSSPPERQAIDGNSPNVQHVLCWSGHYSRLHLPIIPPHLCSLEVCACKITTWLVAASLKARPLSLWYPRNLATNHVFLQIHNQNSCMICSQHKYE